MCHLRALIACLPLGFKRLPHPAAAPSYQLPETVAILNKVPQIGILAHSSPLLSFPFFFLGVKTQFQVLLFEKTSQTANLTLPLGYLIDLSDWTQSKWTYNPPLPHSKKTPAPLEISSFHLTATIPFFNPFSFACTPHSVYQQMLLVYSDAHHLSPPPWSLTWIFLQEPPNWSPCFCPHLPTYNTAGQLVHLNFKKSHSTSQRRTFPTPSLRQRKSSSSLSGL